MSRGGREKKKLDRKNRHEKRADAHRIERQLQRQAGAGSLAGGQPTKF